MKVKIFFCVFVTVIAKGSLSDVEEPVIKIPFGSIMGRHIKSYKGRTVTAFEGIPYAKPPVKELRFKEPQPIDPWSNILIANKTYMCMQYTAIVPRKASKGEEDCLYLYVYVPREIINGDENLDVVVHIHGGAFIIGDPKSFAGPEYLMDRDLIVVSMNYRLGILGFLSTEDRVVLGNNGLKDQALAMKWIKDNIQYFGGNPSSITLTGMSAGGACVHFHYLSPLSKGLFNRGLSHSGTALNPWALTKNPLQNAKKLGKQFGCNSDSSQEMIDCLRKVPGQNLTIAMSNFFVFGNGLPPNPFAPVIELDVPGAFLSYHPYKLLTEGKFNDYPWITSNTKDEGIAPVGFFVLFKKLQEINARWNELLPYTLVYYDTVDDDDKIIIAESVKEKYLNNESLSTENIAGFTKLHSDRLFLVDSERAILLQAKMGKSPVYYYYFDYLIDMPVIYKAKLPVVAHGDDGRLLFRQQDNAKVLSDNDNKMKDIFVDFLFNYTTTGVPDFKGVEWKAVSPEREEIDYLRISSFDQIRMEEAKEIGAVSFWDSQPLKENAHLFNS